MVKRAQELLGADNIECVLCDRGYFDTEECAALDDDGVKFVTPGTHGKTVKESIAVFEGELSLYERVNEDDMRVSFYRHDVINFTWKWARVTIRRALNTQHKKDGNTGELITEIVVQHSISMTNIIDGSVEDIVTTDGQRPSIEHFFDALKNADFITGFPSTSRHAVEVSIALTLLQQMLLWLFCAFLTTDSGEHPSTHKELTSVKLDLLERPAAEVFDEHEALSAEVREMQQGIERDIGCIRGFRRFIQRTRPQPQKMSRMASVHA